MSRQHLFVIRFRSERSDGGTDGWMLPTALSPCLTIDKYVDLSNILFIISFQGCQRTCITSK